MRTLLILSLLALSVGAGAGSLNHERQLSPAYCDCVGQSWDFAGVKKTTHRFRTGFLSVECWQCCPILARPA